MYNTYGVQVKFNIKLTRGIIVLKNKNSQVNNYQVIVNRLRKRLCNIWNTIECDNINNLIALKKLLLLADKLHYTCTQRQTACSVLVMLCNIFSTIFYKTQLIKNTISCGFFGTKWNTLNVFINYIDADSE